MIYYKRLLLIDDDSDDHEFFLEAIQEIDSAVTCAAFFDGEKALKSLRAADGELPDLIILDTNMPKLNGRQILIEIRQNARLKEVPVIMYSTFFSDRDSTELTKLGASYYLSKPSKFENFRTALQEILSTKWTISSPAVKEAKQ